MAPCEPTPDHRQNSTAGRPRTAPPRSVPAVPSGRSAPCAACRSHRRPAAAALAAGCRAASAARRRTASPGRPGRQPSQQPQLQPLVAQPRQRNKCAATAPGRRRGDPAAAAAEDAGDGRPEETLDRRPQPPGRRHAQTCHGPGGGRADRGGYRARGLAGLGRAAPPPGWKPMPSKRPSCRAGIASSARSGTAASQSRSCRCWPAASALSGLPT